MKSEWVNYKKLVKRKNLKTTYSRLREIENTLSPKNKKIFNDFTDYLKIKTKSPTALKIKKSRLLQIYDVLEMPLDKITRKDLQKLLIVLNNSYMKASHRNNIKEMLVRFLKWQYEDWNTRFKSFEDLDREDGRNHQKINPEAMLTNEEIEKIINLSSLKYKALFSLMYESAGRPEEILKLRWEDINFSDKVVKLFSAKTGMSRANNIKNAIHYLQKWKEQQQIENPDFKQTDLIFPAQKRRQKTTGEMTNMALSSYLKSIAKRAGISKPAWNYLFRHTRLVDVRLKLSPESYEKFSGHSYATGLKHYAHLSDSKSKAEILEKLYNAEELPVKERDRLEKDIELLKQNQKQTTEFIRIMLEEKKNKKVKLVVDQEGRIINPQGDIFFALEK